MKLSSQPLLFSLTLPPLFHTIWKKVKPVRAFNVFNLSGGLLVLGFIFILMVSIRWLSFIRDFPFWMGPYEYFCPFSLHNPFYLSPSGCLSPIPPSQPKRPRSHSVFSRDPPSVPHSRLFRIRAFVLSMLSNELMLLPLLLSQRRPVLQVILLPIGRLHDKARHVVCRWGAASLFCRSV